MAWEPTEEVVTPLAESAPGGGWRPAELDTTPSPMVDVARGAANAATLGQWDRARAGIRALTTGGAYGPALAEEVAKSKRAAKESPFLYATGEAIGGTIPGMGLSSATSKALGTTARPLMQRMGIGAAEGGVLGAAQGAGNVYTGQPEDYLKGAGMGATLGVGIGAASPAIGSTIAGTGRFMADRGMFGGYPRAMAQAAQADEAGLRNVLRTPGAMLPDAGPSMLAVGQGAVTGTGGLGKSALTLALDERNKLSGQRIASDTSQIFGPVTRPTQITTRLDAAQEALDPAYNTAIARGRAVDTSALAQDIEARAIDAKGDAKTALRRVRNMLNVDDVPNGPLDPHPRAMMNTRRAIDALIQSNPDQNVVRELTLARQALNTELHRSVPDVIPLDARYAELAAQRGAYQRGRQAFDVGKEAIHPADLRQDILGGALPAHPAGIGPSEQPLRLREGARYELDRIIGTNRNDRATLNRVIAQPWDYNAEKLANLFGPGRAQALRDVLAREDNFFNTQQKIVEGAKTANVTAAAKALDASQGKIPVNTTFFGAVTRGGQELLERARNAGAEANKDRIAQWMATRDPREMNVIVNDLLSTQAGRDQLEQMTGTLGRGAFIGGSTAIGQRKEKR